MPSSQGVDREPTHVVDVLIQNCLRVRVLAPIQYSDTERLLFMY